MKWKNHTVHILPKLGSACHTIRRMYNFSNIEPIKMIYYAQLCSIMKYGMVFLGNSTDIKRVFQLQKKTMTIMMRVNSGNSSLPVFRALKILTVAAQYIVLNDLSGI